MSQNPIPMRGTECVTAEIDGELVLLAMPGLRYYGVSGAGLAVWEKINGTNSVATIVTELEAEYDAPAGVIRTQVEQLVSGLAEARLIELLPAAN